MASSSAPRSSVDPGHAGAARPALSTIGDGDLAALLRELGQPSWRARQLREATWHPYVSGFEEIRQLPGGLRAELDARLRFSTAAVTSERVADAGLTLKLLCALEGPQTVETVAMESPARGASGRRATVCVSTQVGCAVGCPFCATGRMGLRRSCTPAEVVDQVRLAGQALSRRALGPVTHVVYMGMGEPLAAYETTVASLRVLVAAGGISPRRITVSTSGVVPGIRRLAAEGLPVTLAVSLHAASDALRDRLVPLNRAHPLDAPGGGGGRLRAGHGSPAQPGVVPHRRGQRWPRPGRRAGGDRPEARRPRQRHPHEPDRGQPLGAALGGGRAGLPAPSHRRGSDRDGARHPRRRGGGGLRAAARGARAPEAAAPGRHPHPAAIGAARSRSEAESGPHRQSAPIPAENGSHPAGRGDRPTSAGPQGP